MAFDPNEIPLIDNSVFFYFCEGDFESHHFHRERFYNWVLDGAKYENYATWEGAWTQYWYLWQNPPKARITVEYSIYGADTSGYDYAVNLLAGEVNAVYRNSDEGVDIRCTGFTSELIPAP